MGDRWQVDLVDGSYISLMPATDRTYRPGMVDHFCVSVEVSQKEAESALRNAGIEPATFADQRGGLYVRDPDGFLVQILTQRPK